MGASMDSGYESDVEDNEYKVEPLHEPSEFIFLIDGILFDTAFQRMQFLLNPNQPGVPVKCRNTTYFIHAIPYNGGACDNNFLAFDYNVRIEGAKCLLHAASRKLQKGIDPMTSRYF